MSWTTEWAEATSVKVNYTEHEDQYGSKSDGPALLFSADMTYVVEGTREELLALLDRARAAIERSAG